MEGLGMVLMVISVVGLFAGLGVIVYARHVGRTDLVNGTLLLGGAWATAYLLILTGTSMISTAPYLIPGERKAFCGFYLDCHLGISVETVERVDQVGSGDHRMTARVDFYVVTVRVSNEARRATLTFENPQATLIDLPGQIYQRSLAAEAALAAPGTPTPFARTVSAQHSYTKTLVFDVPEHVLIPRMKVSMGHPLERLIELFLIGDEDSLFHEKTMFALDV